MDDLAARSGGGSKSSFGTNSKLHPGADYAQNKANPWYLGGKLEGLQLPSHYDFKAIRLTPAELRNEFGRLGWRKIVAFQTRNHHRAHAELALRAGKNRRGKCCGSSRRRHDQAGRRRLLYARTLLPVDLAEVSCAGEAFFVTAGHAHGQAA